MTLPLGSLAGQNLPSLSFEVTPLSVCCPRTDELAFNSTVSGSSQELGEPLGSIWAMWDVQVLGHSRSLVLLECGGFPEP